jgi:hypothetical protein
LSKSTMQEKAISLLPDTGKVLFAAWKDACGLAGIPQQVVGMVHTWRASGLVQLHTVKEDGKLVTYIGKGNA